MIIPELKQLQLKNEAVSVYRDCSNDELTGTVCKVNEHVTAMQLFHDDGTFEGMTIFETAQITDLVWGDRKHQATTKLISKLHPDALPKFESTEFRNIVLELGDHYDCLSIYSDGNESAFDIGTIEKYDETWIKIKSYGTRATLSPSYRIFLRSSIVRVVVNSPYQNAIYELHEELEE